MRLLHTFSIIFAFVLTAHAIALPAPWTSVDDLTNQLFKRKGGGGGGGKGGGGHSSGSSSSGSKGGSSSSGSKGSSSYSSSTSNTGGAHGSGSGPRPAVYGGVPYYGGGAGVPYTAGRVSPGGIAPYLLTGAALGFLVAAWPHGAYGYRYPNNYTYHNDTSNSNMTLPVQCLCEPAEECGCDANNSTDYVNAVTNNASVARVATVNDTTMLFLNGTLPNGTTAASGAGSYRQGLRQLSGWWVVVAGVAYAVWFM